MPMARPCIRLTPVAPLAGSVDRNVKMDELVPLARSRSPRGERG